MPLLLLVSIGYVHTGFSLVTPFHLCIFGKLWQSEAKKDHQLYQWECWEKQTVFFPTPFLVLFAKSRRLKRSDSKQKRSSLTWILIKTTDWSLQMKMFAHFMFSSHLASSARLPILFVPALPKTWHHVLIQHRHAQNLTPRSNSRPACPNLDNTF